MKLHGTSKINGLNHLEIGGCDVIEIVKKYGTPLYVMDEDLIREKARRFIKSFDSVYDEVRVAYAGKAFLNLAMCKLIEEEGLYLDVVSGGELYTAIKASFPTQNILFHGNNKTEEELRMALENKVGRIVVDSFNEIYKLDALAQEYGVKADIYLRLSPGIEAHTHAYIKTGQIDSKFGFPIETGQAIEAVKAALAMDNLNLKGLHCHIGSQIQEIQPYIDAADIMLKFASKIKDRLQFEMDELDLGGGFG
ncbi:MAG TPA: diaminopimelate decarboxylase, partial [Clostridiaceae bacterium]|nr:diaminopimelate decarboxylase [Clostridiaceae bacterium]